MEFCNKKLIVDISTPPYLDSNTHPLGHKGFQSDHLVNLLIGILGHVPLLWPLYTILWFRRARHIGQTVPFKNNYPTQLFYHE